MSSALLTLASVQCAPTSGDTPSGTSEIWSTFSASSYTFWLMVLEASDPFEGMAMSHVPSEAIAQSSVVCALSMGTLTTAAMVRSVMASSSVSGNMRFTEASSTQASASNRSLMPPASTRSSVVPAGTDASSVISVAVRCSTPVTVTFVTVNRLELYTTAPPMASAPMSPMIRPMRMM